MNIDCKIVQDLLPLYHDGVCSEESRKLVEAHLAECENCKRMLEEMDGEWVLPEVVQDELKPLEEINKVVKKGKRRALFKGVAITMAVIVLLFGVVNVWWYVGYYRFYRQFAEGHDPRMIYVSDLEGNVVESRVWDANEFVWEDETYRYRVQVPDYLLRNGDIDMERLDNSYKGKSIELDIFEELNGEYTYSVWIDENGWEEGFEVFYLDPDLNQKYLDHWDEEMIASETEKFAEYRDEIMKIIADAKEMWDFLQ